VTHADDDAWAAGGPPTGGPVRTPVPPQAFPGAPAYGPPPPHGQTPYGQTPYGPPQQYGWRPPPVPLAPDGRPLADFGTRLLAHLIDGAILGGIAMVIFVPVLVLVSFSLMPDFADQAATGVTTTEDVFGDFFLPLILIELGFFLLLLAGYYIYFVEMMYRSGQTVGKKAMKIRVVPLEPGTPLTRGMAAKRYSIEFLVGFAVPFFSYVDGLWQLWDKPYQQTLHDKVAKTVVVKVAP
jgi:uncharacterized RDD family membrane protein YckC